MLGTLIRTDSVEVAGRRYPVRFYRTTTTHGKHRFSSEVVLGADDRVIFDDDSLRGLETRLASLVPASVHSRMIAKGREAA